MASKKVWMAGVAALFQLFNLLIDGMFLWLAPNSPIYFKLFFVGVFCANITTIYIIYDYIGQIREEEGETALEEAEELNEVESP